MIDLNEWRQIQEAKLMAKEPKEQLKQPSELAALIRELKRITRQLKKLTDEADCGSIEQLGKRFTRDIE